jgi:5S rRNA maturation endonuclease (ribonuclease M5)
MIKSLEKFMPMSCWRRAKFWQYVFVLVDHDVCAGDTLREWCRLRVVKGKNKWLDRQIQSTLALAIKMDERSVEYAKSHKRKKV